ncbi:hypothetical protein [Bacillus sp. AK031]
MSMSESMLTYRKEEDRKYASRCPLELDGSKAEGACPGAYGFDTGVLR